MFYPAYINLQNRKCLVVGGGTVAERKVVAMLLSGGDVTVISPGATELLTFLAHTGTIRWYKRQLKAGDTHGYFLVCAATDFTEINTAVFTEAHDKNKIRLVNVVDVIPQCTFAAASVVTDGELMLSISTSGKSPATSRRIREYFETLLNADSLYTLGYAAGKPIPIESQRLPYPVYLLLENRKCVVLYEQKTEEIERRVSLLHRCGASVVC
ncbi:MAG: bifunctional precorrin-2 dehydrogenase/sirohydrochlorin ferrochelatase, partial [Candidatus Poribacteria bacterium]|nr:bifunctional precorrin-2 dehydrogenase/sirohydrochlorin ferrochelatase [Candidatus Poribacteria bacterium]